MTMSDPIADMLTRIRNANTAKHDTVDIPSSRMKLAIADILVDEGYVAKYEMVDNGSLAVSPDPAREKTKKRPGSGVLRRRLSSGRGLGVVFHMVNIALSGPDIKFLREIFA